MALRLTPPASWSVTTSGGGGARLRSNFDFFPPPPRRMCLPTNQPSYFTCTSTATWGEGAKTIDVAKHGIIGLCGFFLQCYTRTTVERGNFCHIALKSQKNMGQEPGEWGFGRWSIPVVCRLQRRLRPSWSGTERPGGGGWFGCSSTLTPPPSGGFACLPTNQVLQSYFWARADFIR